MHHIPTSPSAAQGMSHDERANLTRTLLHEIADTVDEAEHARLLDEVVVLNMRVAHAVAARYRARGVPLEDLEQVACEGLVKAVSRFDVAQDRDLLSYAVPTIRGEVLRYFRDVAWSVRPPRRLQELQWAINRTSDELATQLGRQPGAQEMQDVLDVGSGEYDEAVAAFGGMFPTSLDEPVADSTTSRGDVMPDPVDDTVAAEARAMLSQHVHLLSNREQRILYLRFFEDRTQVEIGAELGVNQTQVSRWLSTIFTRLRTSMGAVA